MLNKFLITCTAGAFAVALSMAPAFAQDAAAPVNDSPPAAAGSPGPAPNENQSPSTGTDKADGPVADEDVFGFDITSGTTNLTETQRMAAKSTCDHKVTAEPQRFSSVVKTFCDQLN